jgi:predicted DNA binding CopG/RHH family protein
MMSTSGKESSEERQKRLAKRVEKIRREATERLTKDAVIQCRVESSQMEQLQSLAAEKGLSVSALARMWLLERLKKEQMA